MRKLIRLIILGIVIAVTLKYLDDKDMSVKDLVLDSIDRIKVKVDDAKAFMEQDASEGMSGPEASDGDRMESVITLSRNSQSTSEPAIAPAVNKGKKKYRIR